MSTKTTFSLRTREQVTVDMSAQELAELEALFPAPTLEDRRATVWESIKAERSRRESGGVQVAGHWFQTDADSRIKFLRLGMKASEALFSGGTSGTVLQVAGQDVYWKTTENGLVPMTVDLAQGIVVAVEVLDALAYAHAELLRAQVLESLVPEEIDIESGWPAIYVAAGGAA